MVGPWGSPRSVQGVSRLLCTLGHANGEDACGRTTVVYEVAQTLELIPAESRKSVAIRS